MITILSLVTSVKDYLEVVHKLIESDSNYAIKNYSDFGPMLTYLLIAFKDFFYDFISLNWLKTIWNLPIIIPDISSAMISEISVLDGYFHNAFNFLDTPLSYGEQNITIYSLEKFIIGLINSFFLVLPTGTSNLITLRRFLMQGLEAGYISGLGTIAGNLLWISSVIFGCRFFVIPWLSLDIFRYLLGFILLIKYMWDSYNERRMVLEDLSKYKIFLLNFLLALTEQTSIYPFISNIAIGPESSIYESFPAENYTQFILIHGAYLLGLIIGSISLLNLTCWFWENPAFKLYMWTISSFKVSTTFYYKVLNFVFLYLTMICAISSIPYYGLDYTLTNPLGFVNDDRIIDQKSLLETSFLSTKASDRNTRRNRGRHGRRERWKRRVRKYRTFDASLYDQGIYDLFTIEDLNYGFDRFWLRRKMRNHRVRFRFFPGPWMRSFKKQLSKPRLESYTGPRMEFFRILFEQVYHPSFHNYLPDKAQKNLKGGQIKSNDSAPASISKNSIDALKISELTKKDFSLYSPALQFEGTVSGASISQNRQQSFWGLNKNFAKMEDKDRSGLKTKMGFAPHKSTLRKFIRKINSRIKTSEISLGFDSSQRKKIQNFRQNWARAYNKRAPASISSKRWKNIFSKTGALSKEAKSVSNEYDKAFFKNFYQKALKNIGLPQKNTNSSQIILQEEKEKTFLFNLQQASKKGSKSLNSQIWQPLSSSALSGQNQKDQQILRYRSLFLTQNTFINKQNKSSISNLSTSQINSPVSALQLFHPIQFYLKKQKAFERKLRYYTPTIFRKFSIENNAPYFRIMMNKYFYYYKPNLRWERTMKSATLRKARRKKSRIPRKIQSPIIISGQNSDSSVDQKFGSTSFENQQNWRAPNNNLQIKDLADLNYSGYRLQKPTHNYSVVGKKASRYRYQIYKDVLQHWYYSPFNRLLLKFDVDSFIKRQPRNHFLTKTEENLLHLRRFLLSQHYDTLRWYTYMQHYRSMKTKIGGTKSLASRNYNQQFIGTFKKIRHLFAITPSQSEQIILKFDQPLFNEYPNNSKNPIVDNLIIHEELLGPANSSSITMPESRAYNNDSRATDQNNGASAEKEDLITQSTKIIREYLLKAMPIRQEYIKQLLKEKNYKELTQFLYKGQKVRGVQSITNERLLNMQEKEYLFTEKEKEEFQKLANQKLHAFFNFGAQNLGAPHLEQDLWINLLKKWKRKVNDQEFLKNYLLRRLEKREKRKQRKEKHLKEKLERLISLLSEKKKKKDFVSSTLNLGDSETKKNRGSTSNNSKAPQNFFDLDFKKEGQERIENTTLTSGAQKAIMEGVLTAERINEPQFITKMLKTPKIWKSKILKNKYDLKNLKDSSLLLTEKDIQSSIQSLSEIINRSENLPIKKSNQIWSQTFNKISKKLKSISQNFQLNSLNSALVKPWIVSPISKLLTILKPIKNQSFKNWRKEERAKNKQIRSRKLFFSQQPFSENQSVLTPEGKKNASKNLFILARNRLSLFKTKKILSDWREKHAKKINSSQTFLTNPKNSVARSLNKFSPNQQNNEASNFDVNLEFGFRSITRKKREEKVIDASTNKAFLGETKIVRNSIISGWSSIPKFIFGQKRFFKKFKRKKSPQRRARSRRGRAVLRKRTLADSLKRKFKNLLSGNKDDKNLDNVNKKLALYKFLNKPEFAPTKSLIWEKGPKKRRSKQKKQRYWKEKRSKFIKKRRKYRKRQRSLIGKIRILSKQLKRIQSKSQIQNWWWKSFIPNLQATTDSLWQLEKDRLIQEKLLELSPSEIIKRDNANLQNIKSSATSLEKTLQIGDRDFKPLSIPEAIRIRENLIFSKKEGLEQNSFKSKIEYNNFYNTTNAPPKIEDFWHSNLFNNTFSKNDLDALAQNKLSPQKTNVVATNSSPFYAGWDESLRKFIVTNRLLSRRDAGYNINSSMANLIGLENQNNVKQGAKNDTLVRQDLVLTNQLGGVDRLEFSAAPLEGMNAATTLYWQIPFTTYDPDQFFLLGIDAFSPIGWRRFQFRHSILKSWLYSQHSKDSDRVFKLSGAYNNSKAPEKFKAPSFYSALPGQNKQEKKREEQGGNKKELVYKLHRLTQKNSKRLLLDENSYFNQAIAFIKGSTIQKNNSEDQNISSLANWHLQSSKNIHRRLKKRFRRIKKHPRIPVWFQSGPLLNQVLPVHYIYVFYKRSRLPRDRYLKRRLLKSSSKINTNNGGSLQGLTQTVDFTLRKRVKSKRKYHRKREVNKKMPILPRRLKFLGQKNEPLRWRPLSRKKITKPIADLIKEQRALKSKQRRQDYSKQQSSIRVRQLRRRVQRQVIRSVWRYRPRAGGFVWPGDYLRLEYVKAPKLQLKKSIDANSLNLGVTTNQNQKIDTSQKRGPVNQIKEETFRKVKRKKKRSIQEWVPQPKKYLLQKHNLKVIKKKLEKAQRSHKIKQRIKELNFNIGSNV